MKLAQFTLLALAFSGLATLLQCRAPELGAAPPHGSSQPRPDLMDAQGTPSIDLSQGDPAVPGERNEGPLSLPSPQSSGCGSLDSEVASPANRALPLRDYLRALILPPADGASDPETRAAAEALLQDMLDLDGGLEHWHVRSVGLRPIS